jgi:hypothetical protein
MKREQAGERRDENVKLIVHLKQRQYRSQDQLREMTNIESFEVRFAYQCI